MTKSAFNQTPSLNRLGFTLVPCLYCLPLLTPPTLLTYLENHRNISRKSLILKSTVFCSYVVNLGHCRYSFHWWNGTRNREAASRSQLPRGDKCEWKRVNGNFLSLSCVPESFLLSLSISFIVLSMQKFTSAVMGITCVTGDYSHVRTKKR